MTTTDEYSRLCAELFVAGGYAAVRRTAREGIEQDAAAADLHCWQGLAHFLEDDDDHDDEAEKAFRAGLKIDPDHVGLLGGYAELCMRADSFDRPGHATRGRAMLRRIEELAPRTPPAPQGPVNPRLSQRAYWDDIQMQAAEARVLHMSAEGQSRDLSHALRNAGADDARQQAEEWARDRPEDQRAVVLAATLASLSGARNAPIRLLVRYRTQTWVITALLVFLTNYLLRVTGTVHSFSVWGWLWILPTFLVDRRLAAARRHAQEQLVAEIETRVTPAGAA